MPVLREHSGRRLRAPPGYARYAVCGISNQRQVVGYRFRCHAELIDYSLPVQCNASASVQRHDFGVDDHLRQVLVWGAYHYLLHACFVSPGMRSGRHDVVSLELHHGPHHNTQGPYGLLRQLKLGQQVLGYALASLVAIEQFVAEGLQHVVKGACYVRGPLLPQEQ